METGSRSKSINFTLANENGKIALEVSGMDANDALANLVGILKEAIDSLGVDAEALSY
ncbi:MAG: hypothetical protein AB7D27_10560 [Desulfomicrobium sp.]